MRSPPKKRTSKGRQRRVFPDFLPREEERYALDEADIPEEMRNNPRARRFFKKIGERIELIPMQFKVIEQYQEMLAVDQPDETTHDGVGQAATDVDPVVCGRQPLGLPDGLPLRRSLAVLSPGGHPGPQRPAYRPQHPMALDASSGAGGDAAGGLDVGARAAGHRIIAMDETPVRELGGAGTTLKGYLWTGVGDADHPYDCFFYTFGSPHGSTAASSCRGSTVTSLTDAYIAYERIGELWPGMINASCWAHYPECGFIRRDSAKQWAG